MQVFLSYKQTWIDELTLKNNLLFLREIFNKYNYSNFIYYLDADSSLWQNEIVKRAKNEIIKSDIVFWYFDNSEKSEWQLIELGIAKWLWKKIIIFMNNKYKSNYYLIYWLSDDIYFFDKLSDLENLYFNNNLWK